MGFLKNIFFFSLKIYLKSVLQRGRDSDFLSLDSHPRCPQQPALGQPKAREAGHLPISHVGTGSRTPWAIFSCFSQAVVRQLDWKCSSRSLNRCPYRMLSVQMVSVPAVL